MLTFKDQESYKNYCRLYDSLVTTFNIHYITTPEEYHRVSLFHMLLGMLHAYSLKQYNSRIIEISQNEDTGDIEFDGELFVEKKKLGAGIRGFTILYERKLRETKTSPDMPRYLVLKEFYNEEFYNEEFYNEESYDEGFFYYVLYGFGFQLSRQKIIIPYFIGKTLGEINPQNSSQLLNLFIAVTKAVQDCHSRGIIHGDLKANNIIIQETAWGEFRAFLIDFGLTGLEGAKCIKPLEGRSSCLTEEAPNIDPARLKDHKHEKSHDVFSLGYLFSSLIKCSILSSHLREKIERYVNRLQLIEHTSGDAQQRFSTTQILEFLFWCWNEIPMFEHAAYYSLASRKKRKAGTRLKMAEKKGIVKKSSVSFWRPHPNFAGRKRKAAATTVLTPDQIATLAILPKKVRSILKDAEKSKEALIKHAAEDENLTYEQVWASLESDEKSMFADIISPGKGENPMLSASIKAKLVQSSCVFHDRKTALKNRIAVLNKLREKIRSIDEDADIRIENLIGCAETHTGFTLKQISHYLKHKEIPSLSERSAITNPHAFAPVCC